MEEIYIDKQKPLWWILLVMFCIAMIYSIGAYTDNDEFRSNISPDIVENSSADQR